jgi:uncharacterized repeat protein (TIGR01451 family)
MTIRSLGMMMIVLLLPLAAGAQEKGNIELKSISEVEVATKSVAGKKEVKRVDTGKATVVPGDTVVFTTTYRNIGAKPAENVVITNPVPEHTTYVDKSAEGKGTAIDFSTDGGKSYAAPDKLTVKDAQGKTRKAGAADYTHIRWTLNKSLAPGGMGSVSFKAKIK